MLKINKLNNYIFRRRVNKQLTESVRERRFVNYDKAKTVLLLFESDFSEKNPIIRRIIYRLQQDGKKVSAWGFIDKKVIITSILPDFRILNFAQTDLFQRPQVSFIQELESLQFDLMIDLSLHTILPLQYFAAYANASCKTGARKTDLPIYDFVLDIEQEMHMNETEEMPEREIDETYLFEQIIFYLKSIQTND